MAEPSGSPISSSYPPSKRLSEEPLPELSEPFVDQNVEFMIVLGVQPLSSHPLPTFDLGSSVDLDLESLDNLVQTQENSPTTDVQLGLVIYPPNPLFDTVEISPQCPYNFYNQSSVPLKLFPSTHSTVRHRLFPNMEPKGDAPITSLDESKVSTPHIIEGEEL